jgi:hypothetical protein
VWNYGRKGETKVTEGIKAHQMATYKATAPLSRGKSTVEECDGSENATPNFNRHLYDNLLANLESQIEGWNRSAVRNQNPEAAHALWLKAEGLGYALRLLYAFEPEFRELVEAALGQMGRGQEVCPSSDLESQSL